MTALSKIRQIINPPYSRKDLLVIFGVLAILLAVPLTVYLSLQRPSIAPRAAGSTISLDSASSTTLSDSYSADFSWSHTVGAGNDRLLVVGVSTYRILNSEEWGGSPPSVKSVYYEDIPLKPIGAEGFFGWETARVEVWYLLNPPSGTHQVKVTLSAGPSDSMGEGGAAGGATSWASVNQINPFGIFQSAKGFSDTASVNVASSDGEIVLDTLAVGYGKVIQKGAGQIQLWNQSFGAGSSAPGASTITMSWSLSGLWNAPPWVIGAVPLKSAPPPTPPTPTPSKPSGPKAPGSSISAGTLDTLQLEISAPYLVGSLKAKVDVGGVSKDIEITPANKSYTLDLKGSNLSLNKEDTLVVTSGKTLVRKVKFTPTTSSTNLKVADLILGDINQDNSIDSTDQVSLVDSIASQTTTGDLNADTATNSMDWAILFTGFGKKGD